MQDAVILANCLRDLESSSSEDIHACFADFREQRYAHVKEQYETSQMNAKLIYGQVKNLISVRHSFFTSETALLKTPFRHLFVCNNVDSHGKNIEIRGLQLGASLAHAQGCCQGFVVPTSGNVLALARGSRITRASAPEAVQEGAGRSAPDICSLNSRDINIFMECIRSM